MAIMQAPFDTARFGLPVARYTGGSEGIEDAIRRCAAWGTRLLIARTPVEDQRATAGLKAISTSVLGETLVHYELRREPPPWPARVRWAEGDEVAAIGEVAAAAFATYRLGHYATDPRLPFNQVVAGYREWAERCARRDAADEVLVTEQDGRIVGFQAIGRLADSDVWEVGLAGVDPRARGGGVYRALMEAGTTACVNRGAVRVAASTVLANTAVHGCLTRTGYQLVRAEHTWHVWLGEVVEADGVVGGTTAAD